MAQWKRVGGSFAAVLKGTEAIVFCGGMDERTWHVRACAGGKAYPVHSGPSKCSVWARGVHRFDAVAAPLRGLSRWMMSQ